MAIIPTGAIYKALEFDGVSSRDYGVYITGEAVFNAPERDVEMITIPGRNGAFALDNGRFQNIEVSYPAGIFADNEGDFAEAISEFRNYLCSKRGYCRLQDEYNPDEYRLAIYKSGLEVEPAFLKAGEFTITFECKPQRFLTSGETAVTIGEWGETETATGDIVTVENEDGILGVKSLKVSLDPIQEGSGTPSPDNVRPISGRTEVETVVSPTTSAEDGTTYTTALGRTVYGGTLDVVSGELVVDRAMVDLGSLTWTPLGGWKQTTISDMKYVSANTEVGNGISSQYTMRMASGFSLAEVGQMAIDTTNFKVKTAGDGITPSGQLVYELATPQTYQLTPTEVALLLGNNNVWSEDGEVTVEYGQLLNLLINPTLFASAPLLEVEGDGSIEFNGYKITINDVPLGEIETSGKSTDTIAPYLTFSDLPLSYSKQIDYSAFRDAIENGDSLFIDSLKITAISTFGYSKEMRTIPGASPSPTITSNIGTASASGAVSNVQKSFLHQNYYDINFTINASISDIELTAFTDEQYTANITAVLKDTSNNTLRTLDITVNIDNYNSGILEIALSFSGTNNIGNGFDFYNGGSIEYSRTYIYSTQSVLGNPLYLDCDLGEAYKIEGGTVISINQHVDLGSKLPTLVPGSNAITYDNTITDLKVTPRWWKV